MRFCFALNDKYITLMESNRIHRLITKYLINEASTSELNELEEWLKDSDNEKEFTSFVKTNYLVDYNLKNFSFDISNKKFQDLIQKDKKVFKLKRILKYSRYAAVIVGIMFLVYFFHDDFFNKPIENAPEIVNNKIEPGTDKATLTLEDGDVIVLEQGSTYQTHNVSSDGKEIVYDSQTKSEKIAYNYLTIPRGGQFHVVLSDGTKVWLNSETELKYPVSFIDGEIREVELIYGEAYFDVSPSTEHKGSKFKVLNKSQQIEVLGTQFNVKAYKEENTIYTTLVEGKVVVNIGPNSKTLKPSQQSNLNINNSNIVVSNVNVYNEISWKDGLFIFQGKSLEEITKVLSRWYNVDFVFLKESIKDKKFNGSLNRSLKINEILDMIKKFDKIENYEIKDKTVILK